MNPTTEQITEWKIQYESVFSAPLPNGSECFFRMLNIGEINKLSTLHLSSVDVEELAVKWAVIYPELDFEKIPAGFISGLSSEIFEVSGLGSVKEAQYLLQQSREKCEELVLKMKAFVIAAIPRYTDKDLDNLTYAELTFKVALAEEVIKVQQSLFGIEGQLSFTIVDLEEEARQAAAEEQKKKQRQKEAYDKFIAKGGIQTDLEERAPIIEPTIAPNDPIAAKLWGG